MLSRRCWISAVSSLADEWPPESSGLRCPGGFDPPTLPILNTLRLKELPGDSSYLSGQRVLTK